MKSKVKNIYDEYSVDIIPEGKENEYFTQEQSIEINKRIRDIAKSLIAISACSIVLVLAGGIQRLFKFDQWVEILIYVVSIGGVCIGILVGIIKYLYFKKYLKEISKN